MLRAQAGAAPRATWFRRSSTGLSLIGFIALAGFWRRLYPQVQEALGLTTSAFIALCFAVSLTLAGAVVIAKLARKRQRQIGKPSESYKT